MMKSQHSAGRFSHASKKKTSPKKLREEPAAEDEDCVNVNFRLPVSGERVSRRFLREEKVQALYDYIDVLTAKGDCSFELDEESNRIGHEDSEHHYILV